MDLLTIVALGWLLAWAWARAGAQAPTWRRWE